jgi:hypothetical protein
MKVVAESKLILPRNFPDTVWKVFGKNGKSKTAEIHVVFSLRN